MDTNWEFISQSWLWEDDVAFDKSLIRSDWTWEEDRAFENALIAVHPDDVERWEKIALAVPGKTIEELKLHYETLSDDVAAIESGVRRSSIRSPGTNMPRGVPCTEEEHRQFLCGLEMFDKGDWKSISRYCVPTKYSHAQKDYKRLTSKVEKRSSIHDIKTLQPETVLALEKATTSRRPRHPEERPTNDGKKYVHTAAGVCSSSAVAPTCSMLTAPFVSQPTQEPSSSVEMPTYPPFASGQDCGVPPASLFVVSSTSYSDYIDPDEFANFPHFLD